jgi:hypothetical protein
MSCGEFFRGGVSELQSDKKIMKNGQSFRASKIAPNTSKIQGSVLCLQNDPCARKNHFFPPKPGLASRRPVAPPTKNWTERLDLIGDFSNILPKKHRKAAKMGLSELLKAKSGGKNR